jgi:peptidoglycan/LPS O-acetylase OafA/YrhL
MPHRNVPTNANTETKIYFPGLNGIRAIAAFIVVFFHINVTMWFFGSKPIHYFEQRDEMSRHAVVLFFVLSGYLITYLLIQEKEKFGRIAIRKFYVRRILRIWPLFYAAILLALGIATFHRFGHTLSYNLETISRYALFIPNFALMAGFMLPTIAPLWSVGIEEQFYALWPLCLKYFKNVIAFLLVFLFGYIGLKVVLLATGQVWSQFSINLNFFSYDTMAIGGIAAWLYAHKHRSLVIIYHPIVQIICWAFFIASIIFGPFEIHYIINKEVYSIAFAVIILNVSTHPFSLIKLKHKVFDFLGRISYGIYVLHPFVIVLVSFPLKYIVPKIPGKPFQFLFIGSLTVPLTILFAWLSFRFFESRFLKKKEKFSRIASTNDDSEVKNKGATELNAEAVRF